jgi:hypothetical protein
MKVLEIMVRAPDAGADKDTCSVWQEISSHFTTAFLIVRQVDSRVSFILSQ